LPASSCVSINTVQHACMFACQLLSVNQYSAACLHVCLPAPVCKTLGIIKASGCSGVKFYQHLTDIIVLKLVHFLSFSGLVTVLPISFPWV